MNSLWERLSVRERRLALGAGAAILLAILLVVTSRAVGHVRDYDRVIDRLEQQYLGLKEAQEGRGGSVDKAFTEVAQHHSSAWTEAEIHNRLRDEIYRLAMEDEDSSPGEGKKLVDIPTLRQGTLKDSGEGYRQYQLTIKIPSTDIYSLIMFLIRLQASPQTLRIDGLDLARPSESQLIAATINVTRTVVEGAATGVAATEGAAPKAAALVNWEGGRKEDWQSQGCDLSIEAEIGGMAADRGNCLKAQATGEEGALYMVHELDAATTYSLDAEVAVTGQATLQIANDAEGTPFEGSQEFPNDGKLYHYRIAFTVPGEPGAKVKVRVPAISLRGAGSQVYVDNVIIRQVME